MASKNLPQSKWSRALPASIFLIIGAACFYFMDFLTLVLNYPSPSATGFIEWPGGKVPILQKFHVLPILDEVFRDVTMGFAPSTLGWDPVARWQMGTFLQDCGVMYFIWGMESMRRGVKEGGGPLYYPAIFATIAQVGGGGVLVPIYYFFHLVYSTPASRRSPAQRSINGRDALVWLALMVVFSIVPTLYMHFAPTLEERHWWTWFWQLYTLRITLGYYAIQALLRFFPAYQSRGKQGDKKSVTLAIVPFIALAASAWMYTVLNSPYPLTTMFIPQPLVEDTWVLRMRRMVQFDQLSVNGSSMLWLVMLVQEEGIVGIVGFILGAGVLTVVVGPGAAVGLCWLWREWKLSGITGGKRE